MTAIDKMTKIYFVRHAQPDFNWSDDMTRPLTTEGESDTEKVVAAMQNIHLDCAYSSPYFRSCRTIENCALYHGLEIKTDYRFRERESGQNGNNSEMFRRRWDDFDFHEEGGESLRMVQERNISVITAILEAHKGESIIIGTHGTALSTILNYYDPAYNCDSFLRIIDFMPYIIRLDFDGQECVGKGEILIVKKEYKK